MDIGHNNPPEQTPLERAEDLITTCNRWLAERPKLTDEGMAAKARDFVDQLRACAKELVALKAAEKRPYKDAITLIDLKFNDPERKLTLAVDSMRDKLTDWAKILQEQRNAQRAREINEALEAQHAAEQAQLKIEDEIRRGGNVIEAMVKAEQIQEQAKVAQKAVDKAPEPVRIAGDYSTRAMGLRTTWFAEVTDEKMALRHYGKNPRVQAAALAEALKLATELARVVKSEEQAPPGFRFFFQQKAV